MLQRILPAGFIAPCLPTKTDKLPSGSQWLHEIKHDGFQKRKGFHLSLRPLARLAQNEESGRGGREARSGGRIAQNETAIMTGNNRIMIFGPKSDGTYVIEFRTAAGETLTISIPSSETTVVRYFQERMPYGLFVPDLQEPK